MAAPILKCSLGVYTFSNCGFSSLHPSERHKIKLKDCSRDIKSHLLKVGLRSGVKGAPELLNEGELLCRRVGLFHTEENFTVCPSHRDSLGIHWRPVSKS